MFSGPHPRLQGWGSGPPVRLVLHPGIESGSDAWRMRLIILSTVHWGGGHHRAKFIGVDQNLLSLSLLEKMNLHISLGVYGKHTRFDTFLEELMYRCPGHGVLLQTKQFYKVLAEHPHSKCKARWQTLGRKMNGMPRTYGVSHGVNVNLPLNVIPPWDWDQESVFQFYHRANIPMDIVPRETTPLFSADFRLSDQAVGHARGFVGRMNECLLSEASITDLPITGLY